MGKAVTVNNLTKKIGSFTAVNDISFDVDRGEIFGFLGSNGAGKTTTIRMLIGLVLPSSGEASILGMDVVSDRNKIKQNIGYMSQKFSLYDDLTIRENLEFFSGMYSVNQGRRKRIDEAMQKTDLAGQGNRMTSSLPFGVKQRLALASAMLHKPKILFLDEPTAGVDPRGRRIFWELINGLAAEGITIFVTTHYMDEAEYCNRIALLHHGSLLALGTPDELKKERMNGAMLEVACSEPAKAMMSLKKTQFHEASLFANSLHILVNDKEQSSPEIQQILAANDIEVHSISKVSPTLEDVFLNVLGTYKGGEQ